MLNYYLEIAKKVTLNYKISKNMAQCCKVLAENASTPEEKINFLTIAIQIDNGHNEARIELANIYEVKQNYQKAYELFDAVQNYTKAVECLEKMEDLQMKASFYAKRGQVD